MSYRYRYPYRLYTSLKTPLYVYRLGVKEGIGTVRRFLTASSRELIEARVPGTDRTVWVRGQSSDRRCYDQVFIRDDYGLRYTGDPKLIVDGGANVGYSTVYFATRFPNATVVAVEPEPSNVDLLRRNVAGLPNVDVVEGALWPSHGALAIANPSDAKWSFTVRPAGASDASIRAMTVDDVMRRARARRIGILKLDVEGAEADLFEASAAWIDSVDQIVVELHPHKQPRCREVFENAIAGRVRRRRGRGENEWVALV